MNVYRMEDYKIQLREGRAIPTGTYEITRMKTRRQVTKYAEVYCTKAGKYPQEEWIRIIRSCVEASGSQELLDRIVEHCRTNCVWLKTDKDREEYALNIIAGRNYRNWEDFSADGLTESTAFMFEFENSHFCTDCLSRIREFIRMNPVEANAEEGEPKEAENEPKAEESEPENKGGRKKKQEGKVLMKPGSKGERPKL